MHVESTCKKNNVTSVLSLIAVIILHVLVIIKFLNAISMRLTSTRNLLFIPYFVQRVIYIV